ncbi:hypothetical protein LAZ67_2006131 [Cordylochernes scorpioides]|uniref:BPTI/Kunitz inhibitor domain-containing protein n=1 Tax=Cordylochernes scorpioides TaxID=51811 RepID=A0ABY6K6L2_9ARAC|nr:hypothetical protein LAZ67_2006131 [Cordylochernes scorpioides]
MLHELLVAIFVVALPAALGSRPNECYLSYDLGACFLYQTKYYFDNEAKTCKKFTYTGCGGNDNRFNTWEECMGRCNGKKMECYERLDSGKCDSAFSRFYYDYETNSCKSFTFGGCGGNRNNFCTRQECVEFCGDKVSYTDDHDFEEKCLDICGEWLKEK